MNVQMTTDVMDWMDMDPGDLFTPSYRGTPVFPDPIDATALTASSVVPEHAWVISDGYVRADDEEICSSSYSSVSSPAPESEGQQYHRDCADTIQEWREDTDYLLLSGAYQIAPPPDVSVKPANASRKRRMLLVIPNGDDVLHVTVTVHKTTCVRLPSSCDENESFS